MPEASSQTSTKTWAYHPGGIVREIVPLPTAWVPGTDIYTPEHAADMSEVTGLDPRPAFGWTTGDGGRTFAAPPVPMPSPADLLAYASLAQNRALSQVWTFDVAASGEPAHAVTTRLDPAGERAMMKIALWAQLNAASAEARLAYSNVDYGPTSLNPAQADILAAKAGAVDAQSYAILNELAAGIQASPPSITTTAAIDAAFAALAA